MKRVNSLVLVASVLLSFAFGAKASASNLTNKDDQAEALDMDAQVQEVDGYSYDDYATQTNIETSQLNKDITGLKDKIARLKSQKMEAEKRAKRSSESYNLTKREKFEAEKQAKRFEQILAKEQREVSVLEKKLEKIKDQKAKIEDRTKKAKESLNQVEQQRRDLMRQQRELTAMIQREIRMKKGMDKRRVNKVAQVYRLKSNVLKLQSKAERLQIKQKVSSVDNHSTELSLD